MAIVFQSTSIAAANAAAAGATAQSAIRDALVNHVSGAWTLVEEFDSAGATVHWVVLKNDSTISLNGVDFYLCIGRVASTGQLCLLLGEVYTTATHALSVFVPLGNGNTNAATILADGSYAAGAGAAPSAYTLAASIVPGAAAPLAPANVAAATMRFVSMVEKDYAIININTSVFYIGALTDLIVPAAGLVAAVPIGLVDVLNITPGNFGGLTRHPIAAADAPMQVAFDHSLMPILSGASTSNHLLLIQRQAVDTALYLYADRLQGSRVAASELAAVMYAASVGTGVNNNPAKVGALRGKFKNIRLATYPIAAVVYDTIVVDGRKHVILSDRGAIPSTGEFLMPNGYNTNTKYGYVCDTGVAAP